MISRMPSIRLLVAVSCFVQVCVAARINYYNYALYKFEPNNDVMEFLHAIEESGHQFDADGNQVPLIDFFAEPNRDQSHAYVLVSPEFSRDFLSILADHKVSQIKLIRRNIQA
jgi:hypothetical protein